jgi:hypothetical protein
MNWKDLGININHLLRYGYGGFVILSTFTLIYPETTKTLMNSVDGGVSPVLIIVIALMLGCLAYTIYRPMVLVPIVENIESKCHRKKRRKQSEEGIVQEGRDYNCKLQHLEERFNVSTKNALFAFRLIRDQLFDSERASRFETEHSELHMLYLTATILIFASLYLLLAQLFFLHCWNKVILTGVFGVVGLSCFVLGICADKHLCRRECDYLMTLNDDEISPILKKAGLIKQ